MLLSNGLWINMDFFLLQILIKVSKKEYRNGRGGSEELDLSGFHENERLLCNTIFQNWA